MEREKERTKREEEESKFCVGKLKEGLKKFIKLKSKGEQLEDQH
ncbi:unnamed protein product [Camellia sinensis]